MSFVNTAKYLVVHDGEIDFTDEIKPHHGDRVFEREVVKRLVESVDLVESWGGIDDVKLYDLSHCKNRPESAGYKLLQAIADYESIYGEE
ncbi:hypothetical protein ACIN5032_2375 [Acinetobacter baumannii OIFC032]|nr:hypothetical protein ACIN5032_2375 [Acinetobacter baumannii OIFC032]